MKFAARFQLLFAFIVLINIVALDVETADALELYNNSGILDVLKKNQVISDRDVELIKNQYPKLEIKGCLQVQYNKESADTGTNETNEIDIRRLNLTLLARLSDTVSLIIEPEYGKGLAPVRDAYITYRLPYFGVYAGNHRVPFSAEGLQNDINLRFVERNLTTQISPDRMPGVSIFRGMFNNRLTLQAGVWNANLNSRAETDLINNNLADNQVFATDSFAASSSLGKNIFINALRVGYSSAGFGDFYAQTDDFMANENVGQKRGFSLAASYYGSGSATNNASSVGVTGLNGAKAYEVDLSFRLWKLAGEIAYAKRTLDWWQYNPLTTSVAVSSEQASLTAQVSALLTDRLALAVRQESFEYDGNGKVLKGAYGQDQDKWTTVGVTYYLKENNTKIQVNYVLKDETMPGGASAPDNDNLLVQITSFF